MSSCSKCSEESVVLFGYNTFQCNIPLCYIHLREVRLDTSCNRSIIETSISHNQYESIKVDFKKYRDIVGMKYMFNTSKETDTVFHHEWRGLEDSVDIDFFYDILKSTKDTKFITECKIRYVFTKKSTIAGQIYVMLLRLNPTTEIKEE